MNGIGLVNDIAKEIINKFSIIIIIIIKECLY
jgi:hypothetical protein